MAYVARIRSRDQNTHLKKTNRGRGGFRIVLILFFIVVVLLGALFFASDSALGASVAAGGGEQTLTFLSVAGRG